MYIFTYLKLHVYSRQILSSDVDPRNEIYYYIQMKRKELTMMISWFI